MLRRRISLKCKQSAGLTLDELLQEENLERGGEVGFAREEIEAAMLAAVFLSASTSKRSFFKKTMDKATVAKVHMELDKTQDYRAVFELYDADADGLVSLFLRLR